MVTEDYVSFETAKLLKEKGFNEKTYRCYNLCTEEHELSDVDDRAYNNWELADDGAAAPTLQMAMKWLREVHHIFIDIDWNARSESEGFDNKPYFSLITNMNTNEFYSGKDLPGECASYEEACEAAIKYYLENFDF